MAAGTIRSTFFSISPAPFLKSQHRCYTTPFNISCTSTGRTRCTVANTATRSYAIGDTFHKSEATSGGGTASDTNGDTYTCQIDGTWTLTSAGGGGGGSCPTCITPTWNDKWYRGTTVIQDDTCTTSCGTGASPIYNYTTLPGLNIVVPSAQSYTRCVYEGGVLSASAVYGCSTVTTNVWTDYGTDSTCPATVGALNAMAAANAKITGCTGTNCVFWKTSWANQTKTTNL